jgi:hypothetical protein
MPVPIASDVGRWERVKPRRDDSFRNEFAVGVSASKAGAAAGHAGLGCWRNRHGVEKVLDRFADRLRAAKPPRARRALEPKTWLHERALKDLEASSSYRVAIAAHGGT